LTTRLSEVIIIYFNASNFEVNNQTTIAKKDLSRSKQKQMSITNYLKKITIEDIVQWIFKAFKELRRNKELVQKAFQKSGFIDSTQDLLQLNEAHLEIEEDRFDIDDVFILEGEDYEPINNNDDCFLNAISNPLPVNIEMEIETSYDRLTVSQAFMEIENNRELIQLRKSGGSEMEEEFFSGS